MSKKTIALVITLIVIVSLGSVYALTSFQEPSGSSSNTLIQPTTEPTAQPTTDQAPEPKTQLTDQQAIKTYMGLLVSSNYVTSETNGVESTQLIFTNKTFNYPGYISLENNAVYNVTYNDSTPNQALTVAKVDLTTGLMGNAERAAITNCKFTDATHVVLTLRNTGTTTLTVSSAFIDGHAVAITPVSPANTSDIANGDTASYTLTSTGFTPGAQYTIKIVTAKGNNLVYTATYT